MMFGVNRGAVETCKRIPHGSVGVEIGVWRGKTSDLFLRRAKELHLVDPWSVDPYKGQPGYFKRYAKLVGSADPNIFNAYYEKIFKDVKRRFSRRPVTIHRCTSAQFFERFDGQVDWVYIDGMHTFDACMADLRGSARIVRPGGFIFGDDYGAKKGVTKAVDAFTDGARLEVFAKRQFQISV